MIDRKIDNCVSVVCLIGALTTGCSGGEAQQSEIVSADHAVMAPEEPTNADVAPPETQLAAEFHCWSKGLNLGSIASDGIHGDGISVDPAISISGCVIAYTSSSTNLVPGDTNGSPPGTGRDIFVQDRLAGSTTTRVSVSSSGEQANGQSGRAALSANGQIVAFQSDASNLVSGDTNDFRDIFVHDRASAQTTRVSVSSTGEQANAPCSFPSTSGDGRYVVYLSQATNLVPGSTNFARQVFLYDRVTAQATRISSGLAGEPGDGSSSTPRISRDGRFVVFSSRAKNLISNDTNDREDIFVRDLTTGFTARVSLGMTSNSLDIEANGDSDAPGISADGRYVVFRSAATNLVPGDSNGDQDVFVYDRSWHTTTRLSINASGTQANDFSSYPVISGTGRFVAFTSQASNLVAGDTNSTGDIFLVDRAFGTITRESVSNAGVQANEQSLFTAISDDGMNVIFSSNASNLLPQDTDFTADVYLRVRY